MEHHGTLDGSLARSTKVRTLMPLCKALATNISPDIVPYRFERDL